MSTLQKSVLSLFKRNFSKNVLCSARIENNSSRQLHRAFGTHFLRCKEDALFPEYFRSTSADVRTLHSVSSAEKIVTTKDETRELMALWPDVVRDLTDAGRYHDIPDVTKWMAKLLQYNVPGGKKTRALLAVGAFKALCPPELLTEENVRLARILGWCIELLQAFLLVFDDIQDESQTRRNQPCWHLHNNLGLAAVNDGVLLEMTVYQLLRKHLKSKECYMNLVELYLDTTLKTIMGQCLDLLSTNHGKKANLDLFSMDRYNAICKYKTAYYTFVLPVTAAMYLVGIKDPEMYRQAQTILLEMGHFYQVQDDYLDCYGDPESTGKIGTDIEAGKCSWLIVVALQRATQKQRKVLEECYGYPDKEKTDKVKQMYNEIGIPNTYSIYEEETYNLLNTHIQQISRGLPHELFLKLLNKTYRRLA